MIVVRPRPAFARTEHNPLPPRALRASWELLLPAYTDPHELELGMDAALRATPEGLV